MSTEETEKTTDASGGDDEEEWLYGDDIMGENDEQLHVFKLVAHDMDTGQNGISKLNDDDGSESDSDDNVCVTIGDIRPGATQSSAHGTTPVNLNINTLSRINGSGSRSKGVDLDSLGSVNGLPVLDVDVESFEEKPWRKPGADLSDYFNYGFNEDTWKAYCEKQRRLRASLEVMTLESSSKVMSDHFSSSSLYKSSSSSSRKSNSDVIGGQTGVISRVEGRRRHTTDGNSIQVISERSSDAESTSKLPSFFPLNIPPPPFPPPPPSSSTPPLIPPPSVYPPVPGGVTSWSGMIDSAKAWEYYTRRDKEREREKERKRTRERGHEKDKERDRERDRDREHSPSSQTYNSEEERGRHRDHGESGCERHRERSGRQGLREDRHRERRHRDRSEGRHKSYRSSSSRRRLDSEDGESHRRHRHKRSKRNRESREPSEERSIDQENQSEATE
ncbi:pre-mRNA 3'-end-processing factor FIP1 [Chanos chanos]|uniref:Pre-mRNA 3'-end-processing factor FIP1 n=1 Tax=Chanos chanos TaxID=29144 RepID=A0A6J2V4U3_CHACN|nr:pre-mRNA 3'-end-processing factor FIP1 [Chanos chanos]